PSWQTIRRVGFASLACHVAGQRGPAAAVATPKASAAVHLASHDATAASISSPLARGDGVVERPPRRNPRVQPSPSGGFVLAQAGRSSGSGIVLLRLLPTLLGSGCDRSRPPLQLRGSEGFAPSSLTRLGRVVCTPVRAAGQWVIARIRTTPTRTTIGRARGSPPRRW